MTLYVCIFFFSIDSGETVIVGVNKFKLEQEQPIEVLTIDNTAVREAQVKRLESTFNSRDNAKGLLQTLCAYIYINNYNLTHTPHHTTQPQRIHHNTTLQYITVQYTHKCLLHHTYSKYV